jgi:cobalt-zinc-cadmium efflux system outer membrane protein
VLLLPSFGGCVAASQTARYQAMIFSADQDLGVPAADQGADPFIGGTTLSRDWVIAEVLRRNPTIESARQAWREALARYPQEIALADPILAYQTAPATIGSKHGYGQTISLNQHFEWPGKQALRGAMALAEAEARAADIERVRLNLAMTGSLLFDSYFVASRALVIIRQHVALVEGLKRSAEAQYASGRGSQQDPLRADIELALLERERLDVEVRRDVVVAQLNGLLHRVPTSPLLDPPTSLVAATLPDWAGATQEERATRERPELRAGIRRIEARVSGVALAKQADLPDFSIAGTYNSMWPQFEHQFMVGVSLNIPIQMGSRRAGVEQANAALARAQTDHVGKTDDVRVEVREARVRLQDAIAQVALYRDRILPAAHRQIAAAETGYMSGRDSFSEMIASERRLRSFERQHDEALANTWRRRAAYIRAAGVPSLQTTAGGAPQ